jgi:hypothetical protein
MDWVAQEVIYGNNDSTEVFSTGWILEFEENNDIKLFGVEAGTWEWINDKTGVRLQYPTSMSDLDIRKLTIDELWLEGTENNQLQLVKYESLR